MRIVAMLVAVVLAGCATPAERAAQAQREVDDMVRVYGPACEKLGYQAASDGWRDCVLRLSARDDFLRGRLSTTQCVGHFGFLNCTTF
jgi:hypothetical protein